MQHSLVSVFTPSLMSAEDLEHIFVQREPLAKDLVKRIVNSTKGSGKEHSLLIGMRGMGKTHMVSLVYHRIRSIPEIQDKILIAWLREEEWGVDSWLDLVMRIFRSITEDKNSADGNVAQELLDKLRQSGLENAKELATRFLRDLIGKRTLVLIIENMDDLFQGLGEIGQQKFRAFLQEYRCCTVLATTPALFKGVTSREVPFFGFFHRSFLESIEVDEAVKMLGQIASLNTVRDDHHDLAVFLQSAQGRARVRAVHHLAGGNPRVYTLFAQFMTRESLDDLVDAFMKMLDDLTPYYQARMKELSNQQRKIVELLVDRRQAVMVKDIGDTCFIDQRAVASQLRELKKKGYVVSNEVGRESFYELREVLMRFCMEVKKFRGRWVELIVDFLKIWYRPEQRQGMLEKFGDSKLMVRHDLERAFLSSDDLVSDICIQEFEKSLKAQKQATVLQVAEELQALAIITNEEYKEFVDLVNQKEYTKVLELLKRSRIIKNHDQQTVSFFQLFTEGSLLQKQEKWLNAISFYDRALEIKPDYQDVWNNRGCVLDELGRYDEAIESYDHALKIKPDDYETLYNRGVSLHNLGEYEDAIKSYDRAISIKPDDHDTWYSRGVSMNMLGRYDEAKASFEYAIKIKDKPWEDWEPTLTELGLHNKAIFFNPGDNEAWNDRGDSLYNLGRYEEAIKSYDEAISFKYNNHEASWYNRGKSLYNLGRYEEAIKSYNRAISFKHDKHEAWHNRGDSLFHLSRYEEAVESYDRAISFQHDDHEAWYGRGISLGNLGRYEEAIESYDRAISFKHDYHEAWSNRGISLKNLGCYEEAIDSYDRAISFKHNDHKTWCNRGNSLFYLGRYEDAIKSYEHAIKMNLKNNLDKAWSLHNKAWICYLLDQKNESINCFDQTIVIKPDKYDSWHSKGLVQFTKSDYQLALVSWQQAFYYINDQSVPRYHDVSSLIQEFIEELIPRFTQPPIQQTLLIPLLGIYKESNVITELGAALVNTLHLIVAPTLSDHTAAEWLSLWRTSSLGNEPAMELPLRLMSTAIEYKKDPSKRQRLWLNLPSEERPILDKALKLLD
jgi:tetratricopeptide (TPR) repeat protein